MYTHTYMDVYTHTQMCTISTIIASSAATIRSKRSLFFFTFLFRLSSIFTNNNHQTCCNNEERLHISHHLLSILLYNLCFSANNPGSYDRSTLNVWKLMWPLISWDWKKKDIGSGKCEGARTPETLLTYTWKYLGWVEVPGAEHSLQLNREKKKLENI